MCTNVCYYLNIPKLNQQLYLVILSFSHSTKTKINRFQLKLFSLN